MGQGTVTIRSVEVGKGVAQEKSRRGRQRQCSACSLLLTLRGLVHTGDPLLPPEDPALVGASPNTLLADSLLKEFLPVAPDEVPGQRLPVDIAGNAGNGGGGVLLPDAVGVQGSGSVSKESACNAGDMGLIPGSGRSPGEGNGCPLRYSCLVNSMDKGAWQATVHGVAKSQT